MNKIFFWLILTSAVVASVVALYPRDAAQGQLDEFAKCLATKEITMYGAEWCSHCQNEKRAFGASFQYVPYVECPKNIDACLKLGINGYPTWIFADGTRLEGEQGLEKLARLSGCSL
ncbi:MAG TPA: hypothetical protein VJH70_00195 [Candidatus Paceibacterota bacterium]